MAIIKKPRPAALPGLDQFIEAAPDGARPGQPGGADSVQITLRLNRAQLARIGAIAARQGLARASYIKRAVFLQLEADERAR